MEECDQLTVDLKLIMVDKDWWQYAWIQTKLLTTAYAQGAQFFYIMHDTTRFLTPGWTEAFINTLLSYEPQLIGVVAPNTTNTKDPVTGIQLIPG